MSYIKIYIYGVHFVIIFLAGNSCNEIESPMDAVEYLQQFGYISSDTDVTSVRLPGGNQESENATMFTECIAVFQTYAGLKPTGIFDENTRKMMNMPRCGMSERMGLTENKNIDVRSLSHKIPKQKKWKASTIYYRIINFPTSFEVSPLTVRREVQRAFRLWEAVANIRCIEITQKNIIQKAEINIRFASREHGDGSAFGQAAARGNIVAHAFFPNHRRFEGDVHFDDERLWTAFGSGGINLYQVAAHEIGHALGLDHSRFPESVMFMNVQSQLNQSFRLHDDDIQGIQKLYGSRRNRKMKKLYSDPGKVKSSPVSSDFDMVNRMGMESTNTPKPANMQTQVNTLHSNVNINAVIAVPVGGHELTHVVQALQRLWKCFQFPYDQIDLENNRQDKGYNCLKQNVLRLYSLKIA